MSTLLAALDNSAAARPVLNVALLLAKLLGATVEALHVKEDGDATARAVAEAANVRIRTLKDPTVPSLVQAAQAEQVIGLVLGARGMPMGPRPAGRTALGVIERVGKPVVVVPPELPALYRLKAVLVPLDATPATAAAMRSTIEIACAGNLDVVLLHVHTDGSMPMFTDQPHHETEAWIQEFVARHCPRDLADRISVELRVGVPSEHVLAVAAQVGADLITLGWARDLSPGRAAVVREVLRRSGVPVLLIPVRHEPAAFARSGGQSLIAQEDPPSSATRLPA
jgi:nucleotide-binding universal stress UspA family protein